MCYLVYCIRSRSDKIPLRELSTSHVIEYEEHLQPLLLSHAHYSLALGQGSHVTYDFEGVEQQFMEQFIQNKPLILVEYIRFEYTREVHKVSMLEQVRHKIEQVCSFFQQQQALTTYMTLLTI